MRSHENSPYAWVDVFFGPDRDAVHVIDKQRLEIVQTLRPAPGKTAAYEEALSLLRLGQERLQANPRPDMPGFQLVDEKEIAQQAKYETLVTD